jgi:L-alanine-DL-glutamate epimerase-like enolase superfamily enzyme
MKITKIECFPVFLRLDKLMLFGVHVIPGSDAVVVKIHTDEGIIGVGETGTASLNYSGDSQDSAMAVINELFGTQVLLGEDPRNIDKLVNRIHNLAKHKSLYHCCN